MARRWGFGARAPARSAAAATDVDTLVRAHGDFVYRSLARFGVAEAELADMTQEVFIVALRRETDLADAERARSWLYGIARRVASGWRRRAHRRYETPSDALHRAPEPDPTDPESRVAEAEARVILERILDQMSLDQRAVFWMFEVEGLTGAEIAEHLGAPLATVFSRLRRARAIFERERELWARREARALEDGA